MGIGHICADVEVRQVGQSNVGTITLAMTERYTKQDGTKGEQTEFLKCELWGKDGIYPFLKKGCQVYVEGSIRTESWEDQNGQKRYATKCRVQSVQLLGSKPTTEGQVTQAAAQTYAQQRPQQFSQPTYSVPTPPQPRQVPQPPQPGYQPPYGPVAQPPIPPQTPMPQYDPNDLPPNNYPGDYLL